MILDQLKQFFLRDIISSDFLKITRDNVLPFQRLMAYYKCAIMEVETKFKVLNEQFSVSYDRNPIETIKSRLKTPDGIFEKLKRRNYPISLESIEKNIHDVAGVRIICSFPEDIYTLADCLLKQDDIKLIEKKDYLQNPKPTGYRSLHLIVSVPIFLENEKREMKVEVQLRTIAMDFWASLDHKLRYKKSIPAKEADELAKELLDCANTSAKMDLKMQEIRKRISKYNGD